MRYHGHLQQLLNLSVLDYSNQTPKIGELDMPYVSCQTIPEIDFLALYSQPSTYSRTLNTCVTFFDYDKKFDGICGLWNAIYYQNSALQQQFIERFKNVRYFIAPDYSKFGDVPEIMNLHQQFKSRIASIWLTMNTNAVVIPLVSCATHRQMKYMLDGMDDCSVVAFNAKGPVKDNHQRKIFIDSIQYTVDRLSNLKKIIVYSATPHKEKLLDIFRYAIEGGVQIDVPENTLMIRNQLRGGVDHGRS